VYVEDSSWLIELAREGWSVLGGHKPKSACVPSMGCFYDL
jgi:hypothetical protein